MNTSNQIILSYEGQQYLSYLVESINAGFKLWTSRIRERADREGLKSGFDYWKLMPIELPNALIGIQRIKPEVLEIANINATCLVKDALEELLDCDAAFLDTLIYEDFPDDEDDGESCLQAFVSRFRKQTHWKVQIFVYEGRCPNYHCCCRCPIPRVEHVESTLVPASELFAFEEDLYKNNELRVLFR